MNPESEPMKKARLPGKKRLWWGVGGVLLVLLIWQIWHGYVNSHVKTPRSAASVVAVRVQQKEMPVFLSALGTVTPIDSVTVRTQVSGQLLRVLFKEGQFVKMGDLLAEIDPRPFQAQLVQFQGQLQRDQAQLIAAQQDLKRYANLYPIGAVSRQTYDTQKQLVQQLQGTIQSDQGQIDQVKVNLIYTKIISPIDGQIGLRQVDPGNFVQPGDTNGLVVVNTMQPIAVLFTLPEDDIARVQAQVNAGKTLRVEAYDRAQNTVIAVGSLLTLDNQIDVTTGTVKVKANFSNSEKNLFPHQFVNVKLLLQTLPQALVVPTPAIQYGPQGTFVYVLQQDQTVQVRPVTVGETVADNTVINSGLKLGESVIVEGVDKLTNGAKVEVAQANPLPAPVIPARLSVHLRAGK